MKLSSRDSQLLEVVEGFLAGSRAEEYIPHIRRVIQSAVTLAECENADPEVVVPAAILHDVGRCFTSDLHGHVEKGIVLCRYLLCNEEYEGTRERIIEAVADHHVNLEEAVPRSLEGEVVLDADRLEIVGEIGVARWFKSFGPEISIQKAADLFISLSNQTRSDRDTFFSTASGEAMATEGFSFAVSFCQNLVSKVESTEA